MPFSKIEKGAHLAPCKETVAPPPAAAAAKRIAIKKEGVVEGRMCYEVSVRMVLPSPHLCSHSLPPLPPWLRTDGRRGHCSFVLLLLLLSAAVLFLSNFCAVLPSPPHGFVMVGGYCPLRPSGLGPPSVCARAPPRQHPPSPLSGTHVRTLSHTCPPPPPLTSSQKLLLLLPGVAPPREVGGQIRSHLGGGGGGGGGLAFFSFSPLWPGFSTWSSCLLVATYTKGDEGRRRGRSAHSAVTTKGRRRRHCRRPCGNSVSRFLRLSKMPTQQHFENPSPLRMISLRTTDHIFDRPIQKPHLCQ